MKITDECKPIFLQVMEENKSNAIKISLTDHESGGKALDMQCVTLGESDHAVDINGIKVIMDEDTEKMLEHYVFDKDEESSGLKLIYNGPHACNCNHDSGCNCDGGCGCSDDDCDCCH
ncbi:MAG: hypothetical protein J1F32_06080 [Erysipelotrichales bacterium]|nr:hypothetical protein [Erysipelotrichales bacterium]